MSSNCSEMNSQLGKEVLKKEALLNYGLYIMSFASGNPGNFLKYDAAQKAAFRLGLVAGRDEEPPFPKLLELNEFYYLGRQSAYGAVQRSQDLNIDK